jgi:transposase
MGMPAIDLRKVVSLHGIDADGVVISRKVGRANSMATVERLGLRVVAMEAFATAHHQGCVFAAMGSDVRLINSRFVAPFMHGSKDDAIDAEAIHDPACRPTMRFVLVKTVAQHDLQSLHRARNRLVGQRTASITHMRGPLAEYGIVHPTGAALFARRARQGLAETEDLSPMPREAFTAPPGGLGALQDRLGALDDRLVAICREDEACRRMMQLPGVGPVVATALVASIDDAVQFRPGREMAA